MKKNMAKSFGRSKYWRFGRSTAKVELYPKILFWTKRFIPINFLLKILIIFVSRKN